MIDEPHDPFGEDALPTHTPSELESYAQRAIGAAEERARIVEWLTSHGPEYAMTLARLAKVIAAQPESPVRPVRAGG